MDGRDEGELPSTDIAFVPGFMVRVSVKLLSPRCFQSFKALNSKQGFMRASVKPFSTKCFQHFNA
jgi:hypothetical protein